MASDSQYAAELGAFDFYYSEMLKHLKVQKIQGNFISNGLVSGDIGHRLGGHQWQKMDTMLNEIRSNIALNGPSVFGRLIKALRDVQDYSHLANCLNSESLKMLPYIYYIYYIYIYVTGFGKTCIVHTSDFEYSEIYKTHNEYYTELKFAEMIEE